MTTQHPTGKRAHLRSLAQRYPDPGTDGGGTPHPHQRRNRLILLTTFIAVSLTAAAGYGATALQRTPPPPPPPLVVTQPRGTPKLTDRTSCNILTPTELQALIGPSNYITPDPRAHSCTYHGEDGREATIGFYVDLSEINLKDWSSNVVGNSTQIRTLSVNNDVSDSCDALVLLKLPLVSSSVLEINGYQGVTCDQVTAAAAAVIAHLPPA